MPFVNTIDEQGDVATLSALLSGTQTELRDDRVLYLHQGALTYNKGLEEVDFPNVNTIWTLCFENCWSLDSVNLPSVKMLQNYGLQSCYKLADVSLPSMTETKTNIFRYSPLVGIVSAPNVKTVNSYAAGEFESAAGFDFTEKITIATNAFKTGWRFFSLILRSPEVCVLQNISALADTPIANGDGYIYVPSDLVNSYKSASNWSTYASQIVAISEFPKEPATPGTITDSWATILANEENGTYSTKYSVGDTKLLLVNGAYIMMQIVAMDTDTLADNSGLAKITWMSVGEIGNLPMWFINSSETNWSGSFLRGLLRESLLPNIESTVLNAIKPVIKYTRNIYGQTMRTDSSTETIWIPSQYEMFGDTSCETRGATYTGLFWSDTSRIKKRGIFPLRPGDGAANHWRLRSAWSASQYRGVNGVGAGTNLNCNSGYGIVFGFCT